MDATIRNEGVHVYVSLENSATNRNEGGFIYHKHLKLYTTYKHVRHQKKQVRKQKKPSFLEEKVGGMHADAVPGTKDRRNK
jgi:hypothetical protein